MANSSDDEKQTKRVGKVPKICAADQFIFWEASFDTYLGDECVEAIKSAKPLEDEAILHQHRNSPARLETYKQKVKRALKKWQKHQRDAQLALMETSRDNTSAQLICVQAKREGATAGDLYDRLKAHVMAANSSTTTSQVGNLNKMSAFPNEKRTDYVNRLLTQILAVESLGRPVDDKSIYF